MHRTRLFTQHLPSFGWEPIILTVHEDFYEEQLDWELHSLLPKDQRIEKVTAYTISRPRLIGDIGLRAFFQLRKRALELVKSEKIDFVYIPIPSFYTALIGRYLYKKTGVPYGIDYIDPWVHQFPGSNQLFSRHWFSTQLAKILEPIAVKHASLITGVSEGYYAPVLERNPHLKKQAITAAMPYGGEFKDHQKLKSLKLKSFLFHENNKFKFVYAGALLPHSVKILEELFKTISLDMPFFSQFEFYFIGTGKKVLSKFEFSVKRFAQKYNIWESIIFEYPYRLNYLDVLAHLEAANGIFILGSTEIHYTPSKIFQSLLAKKKIFALLHTSSSAVKLIEKYNAGVSLLFNGEYDLNTINDYLKIKMTEYLNMSLDSSSISINDFNSNEYSAYFITSILSNKLNSLYNHD